MNCGYCRQELLDTQPKCTLLCNHNVHTRCFITMNMQHDINYIICTECNVLVVSEELRVNVFGQPQITCDNLVQNSQDFVNSLDIIIKGIKDNSKYRRQLTRKIRPITIEYKLFTKLLKTIIRNRINTDIKKIKELPEYKTLNKAEILSNKLINKLCEKYNINRYELCSYIRRTVGMYIFSFGRRYANLSWFIKRKFNIRIS